MPIIMTITIIMMMKKSKKQFLKITKQFMKELKIYVLMLPI